MLYMFIMRLYGIKRLENENNGRVVKFGTSSLRATKKHWAGRSLLAPGIECNTRYLTWCLSHILGSDSIQYSYDGHPVVFAADGSHGLWTRAKRFTYKKIKNNEKLVDNTSSGTPWDTWKRFELIRYWKSKRFTGKYKWLNFLGRWGDRKRGCAGLETISGECRLNSGPTGPNNKSVMKKTKLSK